ncbi:hypothetical protein QAD02_000316 [Eretmocerus hayati]|uniref:Uncharacterized protein n=1 Tax=Eretmocerus hayati TaxID=131215 RepID=A0ACC2NFN1_9HYME|nr:hypothetical protein QAD02_000316 [Eretmocerus hayati]
MAVGIQPYYTLLQEFIGITSISSETLEKLKEDYRDKIDSTRTLDNICDMKSLIKILDRRDVIRYDNIDELKKIEQNYIKDESVKELISSYENWLEENIHNISNLYTHALVPRVDDIYSAENQNESRIPLHGALSEINVGFTTTATININQTTNSFEDRQRELQELVLKEISKRVGRHWKDISRKLDLQESVLEEIEKKHSDEVMGFQKMFNQAVQIYFEDNPRNWKLQLLQALELARRRDLKEKAQEIILRYDALHN